jgi:hypothetical protein
VSDTIDTAGIAEALGYSRKYVTDNLTKRPDFPAPVVAVSAKKKRWRTPDVMQWASPASRQSPQA